VGIAHPFEELVAYFKTVHLLAEAACGTAEVICNRSTEPLIKKNTLLKKLSDSLPSPQKATDSDRNTHPPTTPEP
jgi:hypothetical protein